MPRFIVYTNRPHPGLHIWRGGTSLKHFLRPIAPPTGPGWVEFESDLDADTSEEVRFMMFSFNADDEPDDFEKNEHQRELERLPSGEFPAAVWFVQDASRVVLQDPRLNTQTTLRVHLVSQSRYRPAQMYLWDAVTGQNRRISQSSEDQLGPVFDIALQPGELSFFHFKFIAEHEDAFTAFEPDFANRWWVADDGAEIWTHSGTSAIAHAVPETHRLTLHYRQQIDRLATLRVSAENGDYQTDIAGVPGADGWIRFDADLFAHLPYTCQFWNPGVHETEQWEHPEARRTHLHIADDTELWTLEGDHAVFTAPPAPDVPFQLTIANRELSPLRGPLFAHVWINRARGPLATNVPVDDQGRVALQTYPDVTTSIKFHDADGKWEQIERHAIQLNAEHSDTNHFVVLDRPPLLPVTPATDLVADPPFVIQRPGVYADGDALRFVLHAPQAATVDLRGEWMSGPGARRMQSTRDGAYWWASVPIAEIVANLEDGRTDYHGAKYHFVLSGQAHLQDPAAGWVERSNVRSSSRIVQTDHYTWHDQQWRRPGWESLIIYQLHPSRFTNRHGDLPPLRRIAREIEDSAGYFRELGVSAIQLMPVNEVGSENSWGYDPAYFYAIENDYCGDQGPDELKHLVDVCHQHGLAVILDVVFNHTGSTDNILWQVARDSFFDGDTKWGAMINFDHPQCQHFFAQNLVYLANEFHIDGFRLDHTGTIVHSGAWDNWSSHIRHLGSGGGWDFLHTLRHAVETQVEGDCILTAEHLPNEWSLTNFGGPMDSQWCDDFHDRMVDACKRRFGMGQLARAYQLSHTECDEWYNVVNYPESHDEVGNVRDRVAYVAGHGQGWRMSKVAAAGTLMARGVPLFFMGTESGEDQQFHFGQPVKLDIEEYLSQPDRTRIREWWRQLCHLRRGDSSIKGPSPLSIRLEEEQLLAFTRGDGDDYFVLLNFGGWSGSRSLDSLNLPWGEYRELWNSTWPAFAIHAEHEAEHTNGGRDARLHRHHQLQVPDYGAVILQRV